MSRIKILVVEDEIVIADTICATLEDLGYETFEPAINYEEALEFIASHKPDMAILDIQLKGSKDGIDLAHKIEKDYNLPFIFLTSNSDKATVERAKQVTPCAYLVKPFNSEDLYTSIELGLNNYAKTGGGEKVDDNLLIEDAIFVKEKDLYYKIKFSDILYLQSDHVYIEVHTVGDRKYLIRNALKDITARLPKNFFRVHRGYTINLDKVDAINSVYAIVNNARIPIGRNFRSDLIKRIRIE